MNYARQVCRLAAVGMILSLAGAWAARAGEVIDAALSADERLVDFVLLSDSNTILSGHGWDHGFQYALSQRFDMYGTGLLSGRESSGVGAGTGYKFARLSTASDGMTSTGAPAELDAYLDKGAGSLTPHNYAYLDAGTISGGVLNGMITDADCPIAPEGNLRYEVDHGVFPAASGGNLRFQVRLNTSPFTTLASNTLFSTDSDGYDVTTTTLSVAAGERAGAINHRYFLAGQTINAPLFVLWQTVINTDRTAGFRFSTLDYRGGQSARTVAVDLQELSDTALDYYFTRIRARQVELGQSPIVVVVVNEGLNDRNETQASVGPAAVADGDSPEAYADNIQAIIDRIESVWTRQSWDAAELHFLLVPSHPVSSPNDSELTSYETALAGVVAANDRTERVVMSSFLTEADFLSGGWYASGGSDRNHLTQTGYEQAADRILRWMGYVGPAKWPMFGGIVK